MTHPDVWITFRDARLVLPQEGEDASGRLELVVENHGEVLMDYPGMYVQTDDKRITLADGNKTLYGLGTGDTPVSWRFTVSEAVEPGNTLLFEVRAYENALSASEQPPIGATKLELPVTERLAPL